MTSTIEQILADITRKHGDRADVSAIEAAAHLLPYFRTGQRVRVVTEYSNGKTFTRTGTISRTAGWQPTLMLMHRSNAHGSWDTLGPKDRVVAVQYGRRYVPVSH